MTLKEWVMKNEPEYVGDEFIGDVMGCPYDYELKKREDSIKNCKDKGGEGCEYCWNREMEEGVKKEFTKADLRNGMVVECKDGTRELFLDGKLIGKNYYNFICFYKDDLKSMKFAGDTIEKVYKSKASSIEKLFDDDCLEVIWERDETRIMTVDEMAKKLEELTGEKIGIEPSREEMYGVIRIHCEDASCSNCCLKDENCEFDKYSTKEQLKPLYNKLMESKAEEKP